MPIVKSIMNDRADLLSGDKFLLRIFARFAKNFMFHLIHKAKIKCRTSSPNIYTYLCGVSSLLEIKVHLT